MKLFVIKNKVLVKSPGLAVGHFESEIEVLKQEVAVKLMMRTVIKHGGQILQASQNFKNYTQ